MIDRKTGQLATPAAGEEQEFKCAKCHCRHLVRGACRHCGEKPLNLVHREGRLSDKIGAKLRRFLGI